MSENAKGNDVEITFQHAITPKDSCNNNYQLEPFLMFSSLTLCTKTELLYYFHVKKCSLRLSPVKIMKW